MTFEKDDRVEIQPISDETEPQWLACRGRRATIIKTENKWRHTERWLYILVDGDEEPTWCEDCHVRKLGLLELIAEAAQ